MTVTNIANTVTIAGKTDIINVTTNWQTVTLNSTASQQVYKVNSLFVANKHDTDAVDVDIRIGRIAGSVTTYFKLTTAIAIPRDATLIAVCKDNPIWLQAGDFIQIRAGAGNTVADSRADCLCSYELISDTNVEPPNLTTPTEPLALTGEPRNTAVLLEWLPPTFTGGADIFNYTIQAAIYNTGTASWGAFSSITKPDSAATSYSATGLANGTRYKFRVAAINPVGTGPFSNEVEVTPVNFDSPTGIFGTGYDAAVILSWAAPANTGDSAINYYQTRYSTNDGATWSGDVSTSDNDTKATVTGLINNTPYIFQVRAVNTSGGIGPRSEASGYIIPDATNPLPVNTARYNTAAFTDVGTNGGVSAYGMYDAAGNVAEWLESRSWASSSQDTQAYTAGGSYATNSTGVNFLRTNFPADSSFADPSSYYATVSQTLPTVGFRLISKETTPIVVESNSYLTIGNANNTGYYDDANGIGYNYNPIGAVPYTYKIQKYEVSNAAYIAFLNAVAALSSADTYALWNTLMQTETLGGISRTGSGTAGAVYVYSAKTGMAAKPVVYVTWWSAVRYANWLHNGRPTAAAGITNTTEDGAYTIIGADDAPYNSFTNVDMTLNPQDSSGFFSTNSYPYYHVRQSTAKYALPTLHEWAKAAYYDPAGVGLWWNYPTASNTKPTPV